MVPIFQQKNSAPPVACDDSFRCFYCCIRDKAADASTLYGGGLINEGSLFLGQIDKRLPA
jgi:hypothetical protein